MNIVDLAILAFTGVVMLAALRGIRRHKLEVAKKRAALADAFSPKPATKTIGTPAPTTSDPFRFSPELFEHRARVIHELDTQGFAWFSHYSAIDCLHDLYGLEVSGIQQRDDAVSILQILKQMFPDWKPG